MWRYERLCINSFCYLYYFYLSFSYYFFIKLTFNTHCSDVPLASWCLKSLKKHIKIKITHLREGNPPVTTVFPFLGANNTESISMSWCSHALLLSKWHSPISLTLQTGRVLTWRRPSRKSEGQFSYFCIKVNSKLVGIKFKEVRCNFQLVFLRYDFGCDNAKGRFRWNMKTNIPCEVS